MQSKTVSESAFSADGFDVDLDAVLFGDPALDGEQPDEGPQCEEVGASFADGEWTDLEDGFVGNACTTIPDAPRLPTRRQSAIPECRATLGPKMDPEFLEKVRPCGNWSTLCTDLPLVEANRDYPGGGAAGAVVLDQDYVVQFDVGLHRSVARQILKRRFKEIDSCLGCPKFGETCLEVVVTGGAMWGDLGVPGVKPKAYNCMGHCGVGCAGNKVVKIKDDVGALDCLKHDLCSAWKSVRIGTPARGYCHDPDCGDEGAMAIFNCWRGFRLFGQVGGHRNGPLAISAVCDNTTKGSWSHCGWLTPGRCKVFQGWEKGQGIPDPGRFQKLSPLSLIHAAGT